MRQEDVDVERDGHVGRRESITDGRVLEGPGAILGGFRTAKDFQAAVVVVGESEGGGGVLEVD